MGDAKHWAEDLDLVDIIAKGDRMVTMLRSLEWAGHDEDGVASCPECNWNKGSHDPKGCALDALLEEISR